jgi:integrase
VATPTQDLTGWPRITASSWDSAEELTRRTTPTRSFPKTPSRKAFRESPFPHPLPPTDSWRDAGSQKSPPSFRQRVVFESDGRCNENLQANQTTSSTREILRPIHFFRVFQSIAESVGLPTDKRHPHVLKYSLTSHLVAGNCNLVLVKQQLCLASISPTMLYIRTSDPQASKAASAVLMAI